jgi:hypothetical protein
MLDGHKAQFVGFNADGMFGGCWDGNNWTTAEMDAYFSKLPSNGVTRIFAVQGAGKDLILSIVKEAAKYNQHLILSLDDDTSNCNNTEYAPGGQGSGKTAAYYEGGWKGQELNWINTIVPLLENSPEVLAWGIGNEPFKNAQGNGLGLSLSTEENYINGVAAAIHRDDPNHLIESDLDDSQDAGGLKNYIAVQSGPYIAIISFHDYAWDFEGKAVVSSNFTDAQAASQALNKPFIGGEAGVEAGPGCTSSTGLSFAQRVAYLITKTNDYMKGGAGAVLYWDVERQAGSRCSYQFLPGDPMIKSVQIYQVPNAG